MPRSRLRRAAHLIARLAGVGPATWMRLAEAQVELLRARREVRSRGKGFRVERRGDGDAPSGAQAPRADRAIGETVALDVNRVAHHGLIRPTCLEQSLATVAMLRRRGIDAAQVRVGVRRVQGAFGAHAWVEMDGVILGDDPRHVSSYVPLDEIAIESLA